MAKIHEKWLSLISHQENTDENHAETPFYSSRLEKTKTFTKLTFA